MHIYFSGIGGTGIGPLALIAHAAGYEVSGSDKQDSQYITHLRKHGINNIQIGQTAEDIAKVHTANPIDWFVYSSALPKENPNHPEMEFVKSNGIRHSKRDEFLNHFIADKKLKLIAIAGTHGKTTTTSMVIWLFKQLNLPISYSVGAKISFGEMGTFDSASQYFAYECDEFDRNFLAFEPALSIITGVTWDHHEIYPTREDYQQAFKEFISQSHKTLLWQEDADYLSLLPSVGVVVEDSAVIRADRHKIELDGLYNRLDAWLAIKAVHLLTDAKIEELVTLINKFPGLSRRMEEIVPNLYSDYAHTPEKINGAMSVALEMSAKSGQKVVIVYEPLTNRRMHFMAKDHENVFEGASKIYWVPSYLAREDPESRVLSPQELIGYLSPELRAIAEAAELNTTLKSTIENHIKSGDMVVCLSGGGGNSLDEWLRKNFI